MVKVDDGSMTVAHVRVEPEKLFRQMGNGQLRRMVRTPKTTSKANLQRMVLWGCWILHWSESSSNKEESSNNNKDGKFVLMRKFKKFMKNDGFSFKRDKLQRRKLKRVWYNWGRGRGLAASLQIVPTTRRRIRRIMGKLTTWNYSAYPLNCYHAKFYGMMYTFLFVFTYGHRWFVLSVA